MAKVKTTDHEEQLSVIAQLLSETQKSIADMTKISEQFEQNKKSYEKYFINASNYVANEIQSLTSKEIHSMKEISLDMVSNQKKAEASINKALETALTKIENATTQRIKTAQQVYWLAGIVAVVMCIATIFLQVSLSMDKNTIAEAIREKAEAEAWKADLRQWMRENPKDSKSFIDWAERQNKK